MYDLMGAYITHDYFTLLRRLQHVARVACAHFNPDLIKFQNENNYGGWGGGEWDRYLPKQEKRHI